jgi:hypothetical protein
MSARNDTSAAARGEAWYQQPVLWLGAAVFAALLAGCVWIIVVSGRHADIPLQGTPRGVLGVPAAAHSAPRPAA